MPDRRVILSPIDTSQSLQLKHTLLIRNLLQLIGLSAGFY